MRPISNQRNRFFSVATAFDIENSVITLAMLIITDEMPLRVSGESRFACAIQAKEQRRSDSRFLTILLSFGERLVFAPEYATSAPFSAMLTFFS